MSKDEKYYKKLELIRNIFIAGASIIPYAGGTISFFLDKYLPSAIEKRRTDFLLKLEEDFQKLPLDLIRTLEDNQEFHSVFLKVLGSVTCEHRKEKINIFRNILINSTVLVNEKFDEVEFFLKLINDLTVDQIRILHLFYLRDYKQTIEFENVSVYIDTHWEVDVSYRWSLVTELIRTGLVSSSQESQRNKGKGHQLSTLGEHFIGYIFGPVELTD